MKEIQLKRPLAKSILSLLLIVLAAVPVWSQDESGPYTKAFTLRWENDCFTGTDRDYTNGLKLTWWRRYKPPADQKPDFKDWVLRTLPQFNELESIRSTSFSIGQNIYTPEDTEEPDLILDDRPYAGYTYLGFGFGSVVGNRQQDWEFEIGVVGPLSQAEANQDFFHDIIDTRKARGWDNQLENEPGLEIIYESKWRMWHNSTSGGLSLDVIPYLGGRIGNIAIYANTGAEVRTGWFLPNDFGTCPIRSGGNIGNTMPNRLDYPGSNGNRLGVHLFTVVEGRAVLRDIFLDGNTFQDSHRVDKEIFVADLMAGIALHYGLLRMSYAYIHRTKQFKQRGDNHPFGAISITCLY